MVTIVITEIVTVTQSQPIRKYLICNVQLYLWNGMLDQLDFSRLTSDL